MHQTTLHLNEQKKAGFYLFYLFLHYERHVYVGKWLLLQSTPNQKVLFELRGLKGTIFPNIAPHPTKSKNTVIDKYNKDESS